jgi:NADPH:quinone reductase-like Zn-dependent oxidoreductase
MVIADVMKGAQVVGHGGPDRLMWNEHIPTPVSRAYEALVRVHAARVNKTDINTRIG